VSATVGSRARAANVALAALAVLAASPALAGAFTFTHTVSLKVSITDDWTRTAPLGCGPVGTGSVTSTFRWKRPAKALVEINAAAGRWTLLVPAPHGLSELDLAKQPFSGTITYKNNVTELATDPEWKGSIDTSGCKTYKVHGTSNVFGLTRGALSVQAGLKIGTELRPPGSCLIGAYLGFGDLNFFGRDLSIKMPAPSALKHHKVVVSGSDTGRVRDFGLADQTTINEQVTQSATVTFKRIAH
jgi:hypothetical protein